MNLVLYWGTFIEKLNRAKKKLEKNKRENKLTIGMIDYFIHIIEKSTHTYCQDARGMCNISVPDYHTMDKLEDNIKKAGIKLD